MQLLRTSLEGHYSEPGSFSAHFNCMITLMREQIKQLEEQRELEERTKGSGAQHGGQAMESSSTMEEHEVSMVEQCRVFLHQSMYIQCRNVLTV